MNKKKDNSNLMMTLLKGRTLFVLIILFIFFSIKADSFCTVNSLLLVCKHVAQYGILGIGMTYVIITGGIDLSVGSVVGLVGMIAGGLIQEGLTLKFAGVTLYFSVPAITVICIIIGIIIGIVNGAYRNIRYNVHRPWSCKYPFRRKYILKYQRSGSTRKRRYHAV